jgi:hypothetical protein
MVERTPHERDAHKRDLHEQYLSVARGPKVADGGKTNKAQLEACAEERGDQQVRQPREAQERVTAELAGERPDADS